ncbi:unnamed protein product [Ilex paraguariensis]|uniref:Uncharacterized protein n=1 Tax=Ilex paraguariensis TaxID=185542 RepID=A0ABC8RHK4_9AQUA
MGPFSGQLWGIRTALHLRQINHIQKQRYHNQRHQPGTNAAFAQPIHPIVLFIVFVFKFALNRLAAITLKNIADKITDVWKQVNINHDPNLVSVPSPALLPQATDKDFTYSKKMPSALAGTEGIAGANGPR